MYLRYQSNDTKYVTYIIKRRREKNDGEKICSNGNNE